MSDRFDVQRRDFLRAGVAVAAASVVLPNVALPSVALPSAMAQEPAAASQGWLRKTLKVGMIKVPGTLTDKFNAAKEAGFEGVELAAPGIDVEAATAAAKASGIIIDGTVGGYHWAVRHTDPDPKVRADALRRLKQGLAETAAVGGESMLLVPGHGKDGSDDEVYQRAMAAVKEALPVAEKYKVAILIENVWNDFCYDHEGGDDQTADRLAAFIDEFKSPLVGVQFDIGNHWKYGDPAAWIRTLGSRIQKLDIKGFSRKDWQIHQHHRRGYRLAVGRAGPARDQIQRLVGC